MKNYLINIIILSIAVTQTSCEYNVIEFTENNEVNRIFSYAKQNLTDNQITYNEDVVFRAKKIDSKFYLMNKGVDEDKVLDALRGIEGEQLFFIGFEEELKQDLMKKYFEHYMDKGISYLSFSIDKDFKVINHLKDTLTASYAIYERNFHVAPYEWVLISFSGANAEQDLKLVYNDRLFNKKEQRFSFPSNNYLADIITKKRIYD